MLWDYRKIYMIFYSYRMYNTVSNNKSKYLILIKVSENISQFRWNLKKYCDVLRKYWRIAVPKCDENVFEIVMKCY